ncbi:MAG TPA: hypothetical protein VFI23_07195 [Rhizomicrobium sp.]|nr:hypothetical protein [Rhizomicrobium sp.]
MTQATVRVRKVKRRKRHFLDHTMGRVTLAVLIVSAIGWGVFVCVEIFGNSSTQYDRALADCISAHTQEKSTLSGEEVRNIASTCASSMPPDH